MHVPSNVSVVGYNDIEVAEYIVLTTIRLPARAMGEQGVRLLCEALAGDKAEPRRVGLRGELVVRSTTASPSQRVP